MNNEEKFVILAAGKGKRMGSELPKALMRVKGKPMIEHVRSAISEVSAEKPIAVVGHKAELIKSEFGDSFFYVTQAEQLGTGHALLSAKKACRDAKNIVVLSGDQPFVSPFSIKKMIEKHAAAGVKITFTTTVVPNFEDEYEVFAHFGRILRKNGEIVGIKEYKDATPAEKEIREVNAGCYVFEADWLWENLEKIENNNAQKEYLLTDLIHIAKNDNLKIESIAIDPQEALGANSKEELEKLEKLVLE